MRLIRLISLLALLLVSSMGWADGVFSASSRVLYSRYWQADRHARSGADAALLHAFITVKDEKALRQLQRCGVIINGVFGSTVSATIPVASLDAVARTSGVNGVSLAQPLQLCNDVASRLSRVDWIHDAVGQVVPLKGQGVIVGVVDVGIDYNHINLCDDNGVSRVKAVYLPCDSTGSAPVVAGVALPGSCYETPEQIAALTTDYTRSSHGTHTTGTAAGSYNGNAWSGMAPEADIVACGIPNDSLTDVNIANAVNYIFDYASRKGQPCVVNLSLGNNSGPNDGSSPLCRVFESLSGPGRICVVSAGNDGNAPICFHSAIDGVADTVTTLLRNRWGGLQRQGYVSMWSDGSQPHRTRVVIINRSTSRLEYASPVMDSLPEDSVFTLSSDNDSAFAVYYQGEIQFANAQEPRFSATGDQMIGTRFHSFWSFDVESRESGHLLGLQYMADEPVELAGWCTSNTYFYTFGLEGMTGGSTSGSISDLATTDAVISVGAYCSRDTYVDWQGETCMVGKCVPGEIAYFSSFGPDECGIDRPDVCAPGHVVLSSANRYDEHSDRGDWLATAIVGGVEYPYYANRGTSMSAPVVTGTIALMLQVNRHLTVADVRRALQLTSVRDAMVVQDAPRWGSGKLDAWSAVHHVISQTLVPGDVNDDGEVTVADVMRIIEVALADSSGFDAGTIMRADVNGDLEISVSDMNAVIQLIIK